MPIRDFDPTTGNLPPGIHEAPSDEVTAAFGWTEHRRDLLAGLGRALNALRKAGCSRAYINGSFTTAKDAPGDFDGCWDAQGVDAAALDPTLLDFSDGRAAQKAKYGGELFLAHAPAAPPGTVFLDFFQQDKATGEAKGIVAIDLGGLPR